MRKLLVDDAKDVAQRVRGIWVSLPLWPEDKREKRRGGIALFALGDLSPGAREGVGG